MNILFIATTDGIDYECDCVLHGLSEIDDITIYTIHDRYFMYEGNNEEDLLKLYGMGFTLTNRIPQNKKHIQTIEEAKQMISQKFYDVIIYGSILRSNELLDEIVENYPRNRILMVEGEDYDLSYPTRKKISTKIIPSKGRRYRSIKQTESLLPKGLYFKREICSDYADRMFSVSFAFPFKDMVTEVPKKTRELAFIIPGKLDTYIYMHEKDYYNGYKEAMWGKTTRKAGWDCMRHYEILANGCIPYFPDIESCPVNTMFNFPKNIIRETNRLYETKQYNDASYNYFAKYLLDYTRRYLTTKELAIYILSHI
jgi:hypothetical protein